MINKSHREGGFSLFLSTHSQQLCTTFCFVCSVVYLYNLYMQKDFKLWFEKKFIVNEKDSRVLFHEREVWFSHIGINIGFEEDGKGEAFGRPIVIFRKFNNEIFWAVPLTTTHKTGRFYVEINLGDGVYRTTILSQLRLSDAKRLYQKLGVINEETHRLIENKIINLCQGK